MSDPYNFVKLERATWIHRSPGAQFDKLSDYFVEAMEQGQGVLIVAEVDGGQAEALTTFFQ